MVITPYRCVQLLYRNDITRCTPLPCCFHTPKSIKPTAIPVTTVTNTTPEWDFQPRSVESARGMFSPIWPSFFPPLQVSTHSITSQVSGRTHGDQRCQWHWLGSQITLALPPPINISCHSAYYLFTVLISFYLLKFCHFSCLLACKKQLDSLKE